MPRHVSIDESTPLVAPTAAPAPAPAAASLRQDDNDDDDVDDLALLPFLSDDEDDDDDDDDIDDLDAAFSSDKRSQYEAKMADRLSVRLLAIPDDDEETQDRILRKSLGLPSSEAITSSLRASRRLLDGLEEAEEEDREEAEFQLQEKYQARRRFWTLLSFAVGGLAFMVGAIWIGVEAVGPPNQPVGPYLLVERQEGEDFFTFYNFYEGRDSVGSNGFNMYVGRDKAENLGIVNVTMEQDELDVYNIQETRRRLQEKGSAETDARGEAIPASSSTAETVPPKEEPFIYMGSSPTEKGPRDSIRLEGLRRFNRGLFIIDIRHMPAGCGTWPAFWLTDEANWPVNGEIDIVEGVNYQSEAKTALHSTKGCSMSDIPIGVMTGTWDTAQGIPNAKTGKPDMTLRYAQNCFVYDPHQWLNQGCVAVNRDNQTLGGPLNQKGGGVYALEWDPTNRHIRTWVFSPHTSVPDNLVDAIRTASDEENRIAPDPARWPVPYGYFAIGEGTDCPAFHFRHMRLVFNLAFCGSVAGNRFHLDCPKQAKSFATCNDWVKSDPDELNEAYWKIRGVYVYEREWERTWIN